jgi:hypothetical protein
VTNQAVIQSTTELYWDHANKKPKRGAGGKGAGSARRLADVFLQFDVTSDLYARKASSLLDLLPKAFNKFRPDPAPAPEPAAAGA